MIVLKHLSLYGAILVVLYVSGWGLAVSVCRGVCARYLWALSPMIAIIPLSLIPMYASLAGLPVAMGGWIALLMCGSWTVSQINRNRTNPFKNSDCPPWLVLIWVLAAFPTMRVLAETGFITSSFQSYGAFVSFPADYFLDHSWHDKVLPNFEKPASQMVSQIFEYNELFPYFFLLSAFAALLGLPAFKIYLAVSAVLGAFLPIAAYASCRVGFEFDRKSALLVAVLTAINVSYFNWPLIGQLPQILGMTFYILGLGFLKIVLETDKKIDLAFYSFIIAGFLTMYGFMLIHLLGAAGFYGILRFRASFKLWKVAIINSLIILGFACLITPVTIWWIAQYVGEYAKVTSTFTQNIPRVAYIPELLGFGPHFTLNSDGSFESKVIRITGWLWVLLALAGVYLSIKKKESLILADIAFMALLASYFFVIDYRYHFYKHSVVAVFPLILTVVIGGTWAIRSLNHKVARVILFGILLTGFFWNVKTYVQESNPSRHPIIGPDIIALETIDLPADSKILVHSHTPTDEAWLSYFLRDKNIKLTGKVEPWGFWILSPFTGQPDFNYFFDPLKDPINATLSNKTVNEKDILDTRFGDTLYENETYALTNGLPHLFLLRGWHGLEKDSEGLFRWMKQNGQILFNKLDGPTELKLKGKIPKIFKNELNASLYINGNKLGQFGDQSGEFQNTFPLDDSLLKLKGNLLSIRLDKTFIPSEIWESGDHRKLGIKIKKVELSPIN
jgi:hypothetical protein